MYGVGLMRCTIGLGHARLLVSILTTRPWYQNLRFGPSQDRHGMGAENYPVDVKGGILETVE